MTSGHKNLYQYQKCFTRAVAKLWAKLVNAVLQEPFMFFSVGTRPHADRHCHCLAAATSIVAATKDATTDTSQHVER